MVDRRPEGQPPEIRKIIAETEIKTTSREIAGYIEGAPAGSGIRHAFYDHLALQKATLAKEEKSRENIGRDYPRNRTLPTRGPIPHDHDLPAYPHKSPEDEEILMVKGVIVDHMGRVNDYSDAHDVLEGQIETLNENFDVLGKGRKGTVKELKRLGKDAFSGKKTVTDVSKDPDSELPTGGFYSKGILQGGEPSSFSPRTPTSFQSKEIGADDHGQREAEREKRLRESAEDVDKGHELNTLGRYEEAITLFNRAIQRDPEYALAYTSKGYALRSLGKYQESIEWYDKAISLDPEGWIAYLNKGDSLSSLGRFQEAMQLYIQASNIYPDSVGLHHNMGVALNWQGRYEDALHEFDQAIRLDQDFYNSYLGKARVLNNGLKRYEESISLYDKVISLNPDDPQAYCDKAAALINLGRYEEGLALCDHALSIDPEDELTHENRGVALTQLSRHEESRAAYAQAEALRKRNQ